MVEKSNVTTSDARLRKRKLLYIKCPKIVPEYFFFEFPFIDFHYLYIFIEIVLVLCHKQFPTYKYIYSQHIYFKNNLNLSYNVAVTVQENM